MKHDKIIAQGIKISAYPQKYKPTTSLVIHKILYPRNQIPLR